MLAHASHAASLLDAAPVRIPHSGSPALPHYQDMARPALRVVATKVPAKFRPRNFHPLLNDLGPLEPEALALRPERTHKYLFQALQEGATHTFWEESLWTPVTVISTLPIASVRRRARFHSILAPGATAFLHAHPSSSSRIYSAQWSIMLRRHLDIPVYDDSVRPLICSHCSKPMDSRGDHATICKHGFGVVHRHNTVRNTFARDVVKPAGMSYDFEVPLLLPNTHRRPADILVQPGPPAAGAPPDKSTAYDTTVRSPFRQGIIRKAALTRGGAAEAADAPKWSLHNRTLRDVYDVPAHLPLPDLDWQFVPLAFDTLGAPSTGTIAVINDFSRRISFRSASSYESVQSRI